VRAILESVRRGPEGVTSRHPGGPLEPHQAGSPVGGAALERAFEAATGLWPPAPPTGDGHWAVGCGFVPARPGARSPASSWRLARGQRRCGARTREQAPTHSPGEHRGAVTASPPDGRSCAGHGQGMGAVASCHSGPRAWLGPVQLTHRPAPRGSGCLAGLHGSTAPSSDPCRSGQEGRLGSGTFFTNKDADGRGPNGSPSAHSGAERT